MRHMMSGIANFTVLQHIRECHPPVRVVMMTSHTSSRWRLNPSRQGRGPSLVKPVDPVELDRALQCGVGTAPYERSYQARETKSRSTRQGTDR